jgi:hypothetical protein
MTSRPSGATRLTQACSRTPSDIRTSDSVHTRSSARAAGAAASSKAAIAHAIRRASGTTANSRLQERLIKPRCPEAIRLDQNQSHHTADSWQTATDASDDDYFV